MSCWGCRPLRKTAASILTIRGRADGANHAHSHEEVKGTRRCLQAQATAVEAGEIAGQVEVVAVQQLSAA